MGEAVDTRETVEELRAEVARLRDVAEANRREIEALQENAEARREVLDINGCARFLECSRRTVERLVQRKSIPFARIHGQRGIRFYRTDLVAWLRRGCTPPGTPRLHSRVNTELSPARRKTLAAKCAAEQD